MRNHNSCPAVYPIVALLSVLAIPNAAAEAPYMCVLGGQTSTPSPTPTSTPTAAPTTITINLPDEVTMEFALIPAGSFLMGRYPGERGGNSFEDPQHAVTIAYDFVTV